MSIPAELKYKKDQHIWVSVKGNVATLGIIDEDGMGNLIDAAAYEAAFA